MLRAVGFGDRDRRRLEQSLLLSLLLWTILLLVLSRIALRDPGLPTDTMNPLSIELAPPLPARQVEPVRVGGAATDRRGAPGESAAPRPRADAAAPSSPQPQPQPQPQLRPDPGAAALPAVPGSTATPYQGGADPFAPLSERSLAAEAPAAPVPTPAPAARAPREPGSGTSAPGGAPGGDGFDQAAQRVAGRLTAPGGTAAGAGAGAGAGGTKSGGAAALPGGGDLGGQFDFGEGAARELWSPRRVRVPDKLLAGQPDRLETRVAFTIEPGGTVLPATIRFDPPLPSGIEDFLRTAFSSWIFSPGDSDGQVRFRYSIKVR